MKKLIKLPLSTINRFPLITFIIGLILLISAIAIGQFISKPQITTTSASTQPRTVKILPLTQAQTYATSGTLTVNSQATITASTAGFITKLNFTEGQTIKKGQTVAVIGADIYGNNPSILQTELAQTNLNFLNQTATISSEITKLQRDLAELGDTTSDKNNQLNKESKERTQDLINQTESILNKTNTQLSIAQSDPNLASQIPALEQTKLTLSANLSQLRSAYSAAELQSTDNTPAQISDRSRDLNYKQLDLKQQSEDMSRNLATINLKLSQLSQTMYRPNSPITGKLQQVFVQIGQQVAPGTPIAIVSSDSSDLKVTSYISSSLANFIDSSKPASINFSDQVIPAQILYVSQTPTLNQMHAVTLSIPQTTITTDLSNTPEVKLPLTSDALFVPIDSIYQSSTSTYVYKLSTNQTAQHQDITTGQVLGSLIQVTSGLTSSDNLILSRYVSPDQPVNPN